MSTMPDPVGEVILGVDTHELQHVAALIDERGRLVGTLAVAADERGFRRLLVWARSQGLVRLAASRAPVASVSASPAS
jgi:transposase